MYYIYVYIYIHICMQFCRSPYHLRCFVCQRIHHGGFPQYYKCDRTNLPFTKICHVFMCFMSSSHTHTMLLFFFRMQLFINNCITIGMFMSAGKYRNILQYIILCIPHYCLKIYGWLNPHVWFLDAYVAYLVMSTPSRTNSSWSNPSIFVRLLHHCPFLIINSAEVMGLRLVLLSCLFVTLGRQKTFSLYY